MSFIIFKNRSLFSLLIIMLYTANVYAQNENFTVSIGQRMPNYYFKGIENYTETNASIADFKGKWLIIDFWSLGCGTCIASFPKMDKIASEFKNKAQVIMVGLVDSVGKGTLTYPGTRRIYELNKKKYNLKFSVVFDSLIQSKIQPRALPFILVIDPEGIVRAKTISIDSERLNLLIEGQNPKFTPAFTKNEYKENLNSNFNINMPILTNGIDANGGIDSSFIARSILFKWNPSIPDSRGTASLMFAEKQFDRILLTGLDIPDLLRIAYVGTNMWWDVTGPRSKFITQVLVQRPDSSMKFAAANFSTGENKYVYSLKMPHKIKVSELRNILLADLERYFGFKSKVETRLVPVWKLVVIDRQKLESKKTIGGKLNFSYLGTTKYEGYKMNNVNMDQVAESLTLDPFREYYKDVYHIPPVINETNIEFNVDLQLNAYWLDLTQVRESLKSNGLDLVKGYKELNVIVVN